MTAVYSPRVRVGGLVDDFSGTAMIYAGLTESGARLTFRHLANDTVVTAEVPAVSPFTEMIETRVVEVVDSEGRCRLLKIAPAGREALQEVVRGLRQRESGKRAARAVKPDVMLFGISKTKSPRFGTVAALNAAPTSATLRYSSVIFLKSIRFMEQRLELTVEIGEQTLLVALQDPSEEALEAFSWGASAGRLTWFGLLGEMQRPEPVRIVTEDLEALHTALKANRKPSRNGVLHG